jgi:hypothetical protein
MCDDSAFHELDQNGSDASLHDVSAEHDNDCAAGEVGGGNCVDDCSEIGSDQNVRQRLDERRKRPIRTGRRSELFRPDFVGPTLNGDRADLGQVGFGRGIS